MDVVDPIWEALTIGAGLVSKAFWALAFGHAISAGIQVFLSRRQAAKHLGQCFAAAARPGHGLRLCLLVLLVRRPRGDP